MRGYVERMEMLAYSMPEGKEPTHEQVMSTYVGNSIACSACTIRGERICLHISTESGDKE